MLGVMGADSKTDELLKFGSIVQKNNVKNGSNGIFQNSITFDPLNITAKNSTFFGICPHFPIFN